MMDSGRAMALLCILALSTLCSASETQASKDGAIDAAGQRLPNQTHSPCRYSDAGLVVIARQCLLHPLGRLDGRKPCQSNNDDGIFHGTEAHSPLTRESDNLRDESLHKRLWPLDQRDVVGLVIASVALFIAAGGGIGGGGVLVPLYILVMDFREEHAVALSNITILGGAIANLVCNISRRHPVADRPLIDWDLILVMEPATVVGAIVGGYLNKLLPSWMTLTAMVALLVAMTSKLWRRGSYQWRQETLRHSRTGTYRLSLSRSASSEEPLLSQAEQTHASSNGCHALPMVLEAHVVDDAGAEAGWSPDARKTALLQKLLDCEKKQLPGLKIAALLLLLVWVVLSDSWKVAVRCGSWQYWVLVASIIPLWLALHGSMREKLIRSGALREELGVWNEGDVHWTPVTTIVFPLICSFAGLIAGLFGVGGGIVKGPLMLELGVLPEVAAASAATMIFLTAGSASAIYISFGGIKWDYAILLCSLAFVVTILGQLLTYRLVTVLGRRSVIIISMATLMTMASAVMLYESVLALEVVSEDPANRLWDFGGLCY